MNSGSKGSSEGQVPSNRVVMSRDVAKQWLMQASRPEFRFQVFNLPSTKRYLNLLRSVRDHKFRLAGVSPLPDLGVRPTEDYLGLYIWSSDLESLKTLHGYFVKRGYETSWIW